MPEVSTHTGRLRVLGLCSLGLYIVLTVIFWMAWSSPPDRTEQFVIVVATAALTILYFWGLKFARRAAASTVVVFAIGVGIVGFLMPPFDSTDVFFYMASGWHQTHYGANPYSQLLRETGGVRQDPMIHDERMVRNTNPWLDIPMPYGFLFALVTRAIAWLGGGSFWRTLALFDFMNLLMHAGTAILLWKAGELLLEGSGKVLLYLYSWNPFIILQYLAELHNDIIVAFLVILAAYLVLKDRPVWSVPLLVAAGLIKYITLVLVPFALIFIVRRKNWKEAGKGVLFSAALAAVTALPYINQLARFKFRLIWWQISESTGSLHAFIVYSFRIVGRAWPALIDLVPVFELLTGISLWVLFGAFVVHELFATWRNRDEQPLNMIERWTSVLFALVFVASSQFYAWYLGMFFPLALLTNRKSILADAAVALSGAHLLSFTFLRRKAIGYFLVATLLPVIYLISADRQSRERRYYF